MRSVSKAGILLSTAAALLLGGAGAASADATAVGFASNSPGVLSGNVVQIPVDVPINVCGNSVNVIGLLNPAFGNRCSNGGGEEQTPAWHHEGDMDNWHHNWFHEGHEGFMKHDHDADCDK